MSQPSPSQKRPALSVIVPVTERFDDLAALHRAYRTSLERRVPSLEFIYVVDGIFPGAIKQLEKVAQDDATVQVVSFSQRFGESTALMAGFDRATGEILMTLPSYFQVEPAALGALLDALERADAAVARRWPRNDSWINRLQARAFHKLIGWLTGEHFNDLGCSARAIRRKVIEEVRLYGDQHRFFPILASRHGFRIVEVPLAQAPADRRTRVYAVGTYARRLLDILTVFFLIKFTRKPLRFFGLIGAVLAVLGVLSLGWITVERLFFDVGLGDRPALLLSTLLIVLGVQILGLGLIGELIIFTHARQLREYHIERVIEGGSTASQAEPATAASERAEPSLTTEARPAVKPAARALGG